MTREEAIKSLKVLRNDFSGYKPNEEVFDMAIKALEQEPCEDTVSREAVLKEIPRLWNSDGDKDYCMETLRDFVSELPPATPTQKWIPVSEGLPNDLEPVNITWINHNPEPYYKEIKDKPFTATGVYFNGQWYWWSTLCTDILAEYSHNFDDVIDADIEVIAWQPLPKPYKGDKHEKDN